MNEKKRTRQPMNEFGKKVQHYMIDEGLTLKDLGDTYGSLSEAQIRGLMSGDKKPPMDWVLSETLPPFMVDYACDCHGDHIIELYGALSANRKPHAPAPLPPSEVSIASVANP